MPLLKGIAGKMFRVFFHVHRRQLVEKELKRHRRHLEELVSERTRDLTDSNDSLRREITQRTKAEKAMRESESRFRKVFERGPVGMALIDASHRFMEVNPALCEIVGYSAEELAEMKFADIIHADHVEQHFSRTTKLFQDKIQTYGHEIQLSSATDEPVWVDLTATIIHDSQHRAKYVLAMIVDIDEAKQAQAKQRKFIAKLETQNAELERFAYTVSHDHQPPIPRLCISPGISDPWLAYRRPGC